MKLSVFLKYGFTLIGFLLFHSVDYGQDVTSFGKRSNYGITGSLSLSSNYYSSIGDAPDRFVPFGYGLNGRINLQLGVVNIPISASLNNAVTGVNVPINLYGASPYYKWAKLHLGHRSLRFSPYTMSGRAFYGYGVELTPGVFQVTAFRGELRNLLAFRDTLTSGTLLLPNYERKIQGAKIGIGNRSHKFSIMVVQVRDEGVSASYSLLPQENLVAGLSFNTNIFKRIYFDLDFGSSIFSTDRDAPLPDELRTATEPFSFLIQPNVSSRLSFAGDAAIGYRYKAFNIEIGYKRVDPYYYSLATNYLQNDIQNISINTGFSLLKNKMRVRLSGGVQSDNLYEQKAYTSQRIIGSGTITYVPNAQYNLMLRYANYQHESQTGLVALNDTFRILTTTNTIMASGRAKLWENELYKLALQANAFHNNLVDDNLGPYSSDFTGLTFNLSLPFTIVYRDLTLTPNFTYNRYLFAERTEGRVGSGLSIQSFFLEKKLSLSLSSLYTQNQYNGRTDGYMTNVSLNTNYKLANRQKIGLRTTYIDNNRTSGSNIHEFRGILSWGWSF